MPARAEDDPSRPTTDPATEPGTGPASELPSPALRGGRFQRGAGIARLSASTGTNFLASRVRALRQGGEAADARFHAETAAKILELLGSMKGAAMKIGQIASFVDLDLPPDVERTYHEALSGLRDSAPPMSPEAIAAVVTDDFGVPPHEVFARWEPTPLASASIGQVHRAQLHDGAEVVAKVQYPGVAEAVAADLANAETFVPLARIVSPNLQIRALMEELRARLGDELDYQREAEYQQAFFERYDGHPFIRVPRVYPDYCRPRVIVMEYVEGRSFDDMLATTTAAERRRYAEIIFRFVFGSLHRFRLFNGDPHPGNYLFPNDGSVVFLDFGSVKAFRTMTRAQMHQQLAAVLDGDAAALFAALVDAGFVRADSGLDPERLLALFRLYNEPLLEDAPYTYTPDFARRVIRTGMDPRDAHYGLIRRLNLPADYLLLNRIQFGVNSILARLGARANWQRISRELWGQAPPATPLGRQEHAFIEASPYRA